MKALDMKVHSLAVWGEKDAFFYIGFGEALVYQKGNYKIVPWINYNKELGDNSFCGPFNGYPSWSGYYNIYYHNSNGINGYVLLPNTLYQNESFSSKISFNRNVSTYSNTFGETLPLSYKATQWVLDETLNSVVAKEQVFDMAYYFLVDKFNELVNLEPGKYKFVKRMVSGATVTPEESFELELKIKPDSLGWELDKTKRYNLWAGAYKPVEGSTETRYRLVGAKEYDVRIGTTSKRIHLTNPPKGKKYTYYLTNKQKDCEVYKDGGIWVLFCRFNNKKYKWVRNANNFPWQPGESFKPTFEKTEETKEFHKDVGIFHFYGMYPEITDYYVYYLEDY